MTGRWRVHQAKPGMWDVTQPNGKVIAAYPTLVRAHTYAAKLAWGEVFNGVVRHSWTADEIGDLAAALVTAKMAPRMLDCPVCHTCYPITAEHLNCAGPRSAS